MEKLDLKSIEISLIDGCKIHAFRSGGGLRVVRITKDDVSKGYGEHPNINEALKHANEDYREGGRDYNKVYGVIYKHYLTGAIAIPSDKDELDIWVYQGHTFDAHYENGEFVVVLKGMENQEVPEDIIAYCKETGKSKYWTSPRGVKYMSTKGPVFDGVDSGIQTKCVSNKKRIKIPFWDWEITKTGKAEDLITAFENSFKSIGVEIMK